VLETLILARHAHAASNAGDTINGIPPGEGLSPQGAEEAVALGAQLEAEPIELGVSSRFRRASETLALALAGRGVPFVVEPGLDEIGFGSFEGGSLAAYRAWAWKHAPEAACPGGGETRADAARRIAAGLGALLDRPERVILAVTHGLPLRYVLDAADGSFPGQRLASVPHAVPFRFERAQVERAAATLEEWAAAPRFADTPFGG
jgi:probable phosphoglycerate mutase